MVVCGRGFMLINEQRERAANLQMIGIQEHAHSLMSILYKVFSAITESKSVTYSIKQKKIESRLWC